MCFFVYWSEYYEDMVIFMRLLEMLEKYFVNRNV